MTHFLWLINYESWPIELTCIDGVQGASGTRGIWSPIGGFGSEILTANEGSLYCRAILRSIKFHMMLRVRHRTWKSSWTEEFSIIFRSIRLFISGWNFCEARIVMTAACWLIRVFLFRARSYDSELMTHNWWIMQAKPISQQVPAWCNQ